MKTAIIIDASGEAREVEAKTVLIVDDLPMMRAILKNTLAQLNIPCDCIEASDGVEALLYLANTKFDFILLDWKMPNLSGIDFLKKVRALKLSVPIFMVTGESAPSSVTVALQAGITDYIVKPVTKEVLKEKLLKANVIKEG